jgi:hypothetical protein
VYRAGLWDSWRGGRVIFRVARWSIAILKSTMEMVGKNLVAPALAIDRSVTRGLRVGAGDHHI